ncbi:MAG: ParB/RepB/Spo0J family partition protein, partial [Patescibacteria group bacterium]
MKKVKQDNSIPNLSGQDSKKIAAAAPRNDNSTGVYQLIDIAKIKPSKSNYRKTSNLKGVEELTDSIKSKGVLQPIIVRTQKGNGSFEIVTGHRRHAAAKNAGLKQIPCILKDCSDAEALEIQVIENSQREDVNPMEEAMGFK